MSWNNTDGWSGKTLLKDWWDKVRDNLEFLKSKTEENAGRIESEYWERKGETYSLNERMGSLDDLTTADKSDIVSAISETDTETKSLNYYGDMKVVPTSADKFSWVIEGNVASITGYTGEDTDVVIPYEYKSGSTVYPVSEIKSNSFYHKSLTSIIFPKGITSINDSAFFGCSSLESVTIPQSVTAIGANAFKNCFALKNATVPDSVVSFGTDAFVPSTIPGVTFTIICSQGSAAEIYAENNNIPVKYDVVSIDGISEDISIEVSARQNGDSALQNAINMEVAARQSADEAVSARVDTLMGAVSGEAVARQSADTALQNQIGTLANLNTSTKDSLVAASNEIMTRLASESAGRQGADGALQNQIGDLTDLGTTAKNDLVGAINEVNGKTANVVHSKGHAMYSQLQSIIHNEEYIPQANDMWHIYVGYDVIKDGDTLIATGQHDATHTDGYDGNTGDNQTYWLEGYEFIVLSGITGLMSKQDKTAINLLPIPTTASITMESNTETRFGELTSLTLTLPNTLPDDYISSVIFTSGIAATVITPPANVKFTGEDCTSGTFTPVSNKRYTLILSYDGVYVSGIVGGVSTT